MERLSTINVGCGRDLRRLRLEKIGFIFQTHNLLPFLNSIENVAEVMELRGVKPRGARAEARSC